jgi:hypothetical protein
VPYLEINLLNEERYRFRDQLLSQMPFSLSSALRLFFIYKIRNVVLSTISKIEIAVVLENI